MRNITKSRGFSTGIAILLVLVVAAIGLMGWYVLQRNDSVRPSTSSSSQIKNLKRYTDTAGLYTIDYPSGWVVKQAEDCCEGPRKDYSKISRSVTFIPPNTPTGRSGYGLTVQGDKTSDLAEQIRKNWSDNKHIPEEVTVHGYPTQYVKVDFKGDAEHYTDDNYLVTHGSASVYITFRENYYHQYPAEDWNATSYLADFRNILESIRFTN